MRVLIAYVVTEDQTRKICRFYADRLIEQGYSAELLHLGDAAILAASLHLDACQQDMRHVAEAGSAPLGEGPTMFLPVSLTVTGGEADDLAELDKTAQWSLEITGGIPRMSSLSQEHPGSPDAISFGLGDAVNPGPAGSSDRSEERSRIHRLAGFASLGS